MYLLAYWRHSEKRINIDQEKVILSLKLVMCGGGDGSGWPRARVAPPSGRYSSSSRLVVVM